MSFRKQTGTSSIKYPRTAVSIYTNTRRVPGNVRVPHAMGGYRGRILRPRDASEFSSPTLASAFFYFYFYFLFNLFPYCNDVYRNFPFFLESFFIITLPLSCPLHSTRRPRHSYYRSDLHFPNSFSFLSISSPLHPDFRKRVNPSPNALRAVDTLRPSNSFSASDFGGALTKFDVEPQKSTSLVVSDFPPSPHSLPAGSFAEAFDCSRGAEFRIDRLSAALLQDPHFNFQGPSLRSQKPRGFFPSISNRRTITLGEDGDPGTPFFLVRLAPTTAFVIVAPLLCL
jgi:hypothetical protein